MSDRPTYLLTLQPLPSHLPIPNRLKRLLKVLLRSYGLKCLAIEETKEPSKEHENE